MKRILLIMSCLLGLLSGCARSSQPVATPAALPTMQAVGELLSAPLPGQADVVGYLLLSADGGRLVDRLYLGGAAPEPVGAQIWLGAVALPAKAELSEQGGLHYAVVQASGRLDGPGSFGPGGQAAFQLLEPQLTILTLREISIALLLSNSQLYEGQAVRLNGQLLASPSATLLAEQLGPGGVPSDASLQVKVLGPIDSAELGTGFSSNAGGAIRYGPAQIVGLWRGGTLYPFTVEPGS